MFSSKSSSVKACILLKIFSLKTILFFLLISNLDITMWIFFRIIGSFWHFCGILAQIVLDIFNLLCCHSVFLARLSEVNFVDGVGAGSSRDITESNGSFVRSSLVQPGFLVNQEKSDWNPKKIFFYGLASLLTLPRA